jgi:hypothetical protein
MFRRITYAMIRKAMKDTPYCMSVVGTEAKAVEQAVNEGIDSHLHRIGYKEAEVIPDVE